MDVPNDAEQPEDPGLAGGTMQADAFGQTHAFGPADAFGHVDAVSFESDLDPAERLRQAAMQVAAIAQAGLTYGEGRFDLDRYRKLSALAAELFAVITDRPVAQLASELGRDIGYQTPKVDVRGVVFDADERVLLMREVTDGLWSLPGGWADPLDTPTVAVTREIAEETGYPAEVVKLVGCLDRDKQGHLPRLPVHVYKLIFLCRVTGDPVAPAALETLDVGWFGLDELPELSRGRIHPRQIARALEHHRDPSLPTDLD